MDAKEPKPWKKEQTQPNSNNNGPPPMPKDILYTSSTKIDVRRCEMLFLSDSTLALGLRIAG